MKKIHLLLGFVLILAAAPAFAGDLTTTAALIGTSHSVRCKAFNLTKKTITARIQLIRMFDGVILQDTGSFPLAPGLETSISQAGPGDELACRCVKATRSAVRCALGVSGTHADFTEELVVTAP